MKTLVLLVLCCTVGVFAEELPFRERCDQVFEKLNYKHNSFFKECNPDMVPYGDSIEIDIDLAGKDGLSEHRKSFQPSGKQTLSLSYINKKGQRVQKTMTVSAGNINTGARRTGRVVHNVLVTYLNARNRDSFLGFWGSKNSPVSFLKREISERFKNGEISKVTYREQLAVLKDKKFSRFLRRHKDSKESLRKSIGFLKRARGQKLVTGLERFVTDAKINRSKTPVGVMDLKPHAVKHCSRTYNMADMGYAVKVLPQNGPFQGIYIHSNVSTGGSGVPQSAGCIRVGKHDARFLYCFLQKNKGRLARANIHERKGHETQGVTGVHTLASSNEAAGEAIQ